MSGQFLKKGIAHIPRCFLETASGLPCEFRNIFAPDVQRNLQFSTGFTAELLVTVGVLAADAVIHVRGGEGDAVFRTPVREMPEEAGGIRAAGIGSDHGTGIL